MRFLSFGMEVQSLVMRGWALSGVEGVDGVFPRRLHDGSGGRFALVLGTPSTPSTATSPLFPRPLHATLTRVALRLADATTLCTVEWRGTGALFSLRLEADGTLGVYIRGAKVGHLDALPLRGAWHTLSVHAEVFTSSTTLKVFEGADRRVPVFSGTFAHSPTLDLGVTTLRLQSDGASFDDIALNNITASFTGTYVTGLGNITTASGVTAEIYGSDSATKTLHMKNVSGELSFGESFTSDFGISGTFTATPSTSNTLGLDHNSKMPPYDGFTALLSPATQGAFSQWDPSPDHGVGNKRTNVAKWSTPARDDEHLISDLLFRQQSFALSSTPQSALTVSNITPLISAAASARNRVYLKLYMAGGEYSSLTATVGAPYQGVEKAWDINPDTGLVWTPADIASMEAGWYGY